MDSKHNKINEMVKRMAEEDINITIIDNSVIDISGLNGSRLHLNAKVPHSWLYSFKVLRSGSGRHSQAYKGFQISSIQ